jgi:hypothetical protein
MELFDDIENLDQVHALKPVQDPDILRTFLQMPLSIDDEKWHLYSDVSYLTSMKYRFLAADRPY